MSAAAHAALSRAYARYDRLTAYGCATRQAPYDAATCRRAHDAYNAARLAAGAAPVPWDWRVLT